VTTDGAAGEIAHDVADLALAELGRRRVGWAEANMPVLAAIRHRFAQERPLAGLTVGACLHVTAETAALLRALVSGGAAVAACASNPLSTQDDVAASLVADDGISVHARRGEGHERYYAHIDAVLDARPDLTMDDGCDLVSRLHLERPGEVGRVVAGTEETTTGVVRLRAMEREGALGYPIVAVNGAGTTHLFDNRHGTGQSALDGLMRATNVLIAGRKVVVAGYGECGKGVASRARGMGASVIVTEVDPLRALEAVLDGFRVLPMAAAAEEGDIFVTATGNRWVITGEHLGSMRDGAILANAGHFDVEIDLAALERLAAGRRRAVRPALVEFDLSAPALAAGAAAPAGGQGSRRIYLVAEGRVVNLGAAEGNPPAVMDLSFASQALALEWLVAHRGELQRRVYDVPEQIDTDIARLKLETMGIGIDALSDAQRDYLSSWKLGT
jgi:adenosylhomocysteinase